jgi:hypothetical protein
MEIAVALLTATGKLTRILRNVPAWEKGDKGKRAGDYTTVADRPMAGRRRPSGQACLAEADPADSGYSSWRLLLATPTVAVARSVSVSYCMHLGREGQRWIPDGWHLLRARPETQATGCWDWTDAAASGGLVRVTPSRPRGAGKKRRKRGGKSKAFVRGTSSGTVQYLLYSMAMLVQ